MINLNTTAWDTGTLAFWRTVAPSFNCQSATGAAKRFAAQHGRAVIMRADDGATVFTRLDGGMVTRKLYRAASVTWEGGAA